MDALFADNRSGPEIQSVLYTSAIPRAWRGIIIEVLQNEANKLFLMVNDEVSGNACSPNFEKGSTVAWTRNSRVKVRPIAG